MRRVVLVLFLAFAATAVSASTASANSLDASCNGGSCTPWFKADVALSWAIDPTPDFASPGCDPATFSAEGDHSVECAVTWSDGSADQTVHVKIDLTPPTLAPGLSRPPDSGTGTWYNHPVALDLLTGSTDNLSGIASCDAPVYSGPDSGAAQLSGTCTDNAGNKSSPDGVTFGYDTAAPSVTGAPDRPPDRNGWYNHPVGLALQDTDTLSGPGPCQPAAYSGPDSATAVTTGTCTDVAGNVGQVAVQFPYDATSPTVTGAAADRPPDHDGWYNHPVTFSFQGTDGTSGVASCTTASYSGPVDSTAAVNGACTDVAGNIGLGSQRFKYDDTRPAAPQVQVTPGNRRVDLSWILPKDASNVTVSRSQQGSSATPVVVYSGARSSFLDKGLKNGVKYRYAVTDSDQAGNSTTNVVRAIPTASSLRPFVGTVVTSPPLLTWKKIKRASYYNVQLFFGKKKVLSIWPREPSLQLKQRWHFRGKTYTLQPGHYRWYVWPGFGRLSAHDYGNRIGRSSFRVA